MTSQMFLPDDALWKMRLLKLNWHYNTPLIGIRHIQHQKNINKPPKRLKVPAFLVINAKSTMISINFQQRKTESDIIPNNLEENNQES